MTMQYTILNGIHSPADIRKMDIDDLTKLAAEMRAALIHKLSTTGGHVGPNLGFIEATIALHYVFNTPVDKLVFDVSHQSYSHKMLTGRMEAFTAPEHYADVTGYTNPAESPDYDLFSVGHTSTAIPMATGLAKARDLTGGKENVIAVVGDGSLGGGMALEGLDYGGTLNSNFIVVLNDNDMSIAENHGALYDELRRLRNSNGTVPNNIFRALNYDYIYVGYGNDLKSLIEAFRAVKDSTHPVVVHINTMKGMGLAPAESRKEAFHYSAPFNAQTGTLLNSYAAGTAPASYDAIFSDHMLELFNTGANIALLTAGTPGSLGFTPRKREQAGHRFIDVGICEQQAVSMCAGLYKGGTRPIFGVVSTFLQRAYDQLSHDIALNRIPAVFTVFFGGVYGLSDSTHLGFFDIAYISSIPGILYLAPTCREEFIAMLDWSLKQTATPVAIRVPGKVTSRPDCTLLADYTEPPYEILRKGSKCAIIGAGTFLANALAAADILSEKGIDVTVINPRSFTYLDTATLDTLKDYHIVVTLEDGETAGGYGQRVASYLGQAPCEVVNLGLPHTFPDRYKAADLLHLCRLEPEQIASIIEQSIEK